MVKRFVNGVRFLYRKNKVQLIEGEARLAGRDEDALTVVGERQIKARNVILATGSRPNAFPGMEIDGEVVQHSWQTVVNRSAGEDRDRRRGDHLLRDGHHLPRLRLPGDHLEACAPPAGDGGAGLHAWSGPSSARGSSSRPG